MSPPKLVAGKACVVGDEVCVEVSAASLPGGGPWNPRRRPRTARRRAPDVLAGFLGQTGGQYLDGSGCDPDSPPCAPDLKTKQGLKDSIGMYAVRCYKCVKWRKIPTKEEFEMIRESSAEDPGAEDEKKLRYGRRHTSPTGVLRQCEDPWFCGRDPSAGRSCQQPEDIPYDSSHIWVMDKPGIPRPPPETERLVIMRRDLSKMDTYYQLPNGKRARAGGDVERFLQENPGYRAKLSVSKFCFVTPKIVKETVGKSSLWRAAKAREGKVRGDRYAGF